MVDLLQPELNAADNDTLEEEYNVLLSDKAVEMEYLLSLEKQVEKLKVTMFDPSNIYKRKGS